MIFLLGLIKVYYAKQGPLSLFCFCVAGRRVHQQCLRLVGLHYIQTTPCPSVLTSTSYIFWRWKLRRGPVRVVCGAAGRSPRRHTVIPRSPFRTAAQLLNCRCGAGRGGWWCRGRNHLKFQYQIRVCMTDQILHHWLCGWLMEIILLGYHLNMIIRGGCVNSNKRWAGNKKAEHQ